MSYEQIAWWKIPEEEKGNIKLQIERGNRVWLAHTFSRLELFPGLCPLCPAGIQQANLMWRRYYEENHGNTGGENTPR